MPGARWLVSWLLEQIPSSVVHAVDGGAFYPWNRGPLITTPYLDLHGHPHVDGVQYTTHA